MRASKRRRRPTEPTALPETADEWDKLGEFHDARFRFFSMQAESHGRLRDRSREIAAAMRGGMRITPTGEAAFSPRDHAAAPMQDKAIAFLKHTPGAGYAELTTHLYGVTNSTTLNRARVLVLKLRENHAIGGSPGAWKVLRPGKRGA